MRLFRAVPAYVWIVLSSVLSYPCAISSSAAENNVTGAKLVIVDAPEMCSKQDCDLLKLIEQDYELQGLDLVVESFLSRAGSSCGKKVAAIARIRVKIPEVKIEVENCASRTVSKRWIPYDETDPNKTVTVAHIAAAMLLTSLSDEPYVDDSGSIELPRSQNDDKARHGPAKPLQKPRVDTNGPAGHGPRPGKTQSKVETVEGTGTNGETGRKKAVGGNAEGNMRRVLREMKGPAPGDSSAELYAMFSLTVVPGPGMSLGGGAGMLLGLGSDVFLGVRLLVNGSTKSEKDGYSAELQSMPFTVGVCYRHEFEVLRLGTCGEMDVKLDSIASRGGTPSSSRYDLRINAGFGASGHLGVMVLNRLVSLDILVSGKYYATAQRYTVNGKTLVETARYAIGTAALMGIRF